MSQFVIVNPQGDYFQEVARRSWVRVSDEALFTDHLPDATRFSSADKAFRALSVLGIASKPNYSVAMVDTTRGVPARNLSSDRVA